MAKTNTPVNSPDTYWAADTVENCSAHAVYLIDQYYRATVEGGWQNLWRRMYNMYFAGQQRGGKISKGGDMGEYSLMSVNQLRNLLQHILQLTTGQRPAWDPRAINSDIESQKQTILARGLLDYYMREKRVERDLNKAAEFGLVFGEGFVTAVWNATKGKDYGVDPDTHIHVREGDLDYASHEPIDVVRDPNLEEWRQRQWVMVRTYVSKYILAAKYPEFKEILLAERFTLNTRHHYRTVNNGQEYGTDLIPIYTLYHVRNDACPDGRQMEMLPDGTVLTDGPLPYRHLPCHRMAAAEVYGTPFGFTVAYDLSALQENYDNLFSTIVTNQETFGVQNILVPIGSGFNVVDFAGQLKVLEYNPDTGKPEPLNLLHTPPEIFQFLKDCEMTMQTISGVNSVSRGDPQASLKSGAALALVQSMAIQFNAPLQQAYVELLEDVGTSTIQILQDYASVPRVAAIAGKYNKSFVQEFTKDDISNIDRVIVDAGNPLMQTVAGKMELAQQMVQMGFIKMPDELLSVINTGSLQPLEQGKEMELLYVQQENEELKEGRPCTAIKTDDHVLHINEHKSVLADVEARKNPNIVSAALQHLQDHIDLLQDPANANLLHLLNQPVIPPAAPPGTPAMPGAAGALPGAGPSAPNNANGQVAAMQPKQPSMPKNALTGHQFNNTTGGL